MDTSVSPGTRLIVKSMSLFGGSVGRGFGHISCTTSQMLRKLKRHSARGILACKVEIRISFTFCVTFLYFGPYFMDIGHDFVESVES